VACASTPSSTAESGATGGSGATSAGASAGGGGDTVGGDALEASSSSRLEGELPMVAFASLGAGMSDPAGLMKASFKTSIFSNPRLLLGFFLFGLGLIFSYHKKMVDRGWELPV